MTEQRRIFHLLVLTVTKSNTADDTVFQMLLRTGDIKCILGFIDFRVEQGKRIVYCIAP